MLLVEKQRPLFFLLSFIVMILLNISGLVVAQDDAITISVDASQVLNEISPYAISVVHAPGGTSASAAEEAAAIDIGFVRFPHGNWGDLNDLTPFHVDLFMAEIRRWGATASINVRFLDSDPETAAELVRYVNIESDYDVRYWYIGNEPTLYDDYTAERYSTEWREFALAMLEVDPDILFIGPELHQFPDNNDPNDYKYEFKDVWLREFLTMNGDLVDVVAVHRYPFPLSLSETTTIPQMRENVPDWSVLVANMREVIDETIGEDRPIGITEVNSHWSNTGGGVGTPDSYYNAIWYSGVLTTLIHEEVDIISYFQLYRVGIGHGILDRYEPNPTYYTFVLYTQMGETRLHSESSDQYVTALAGNREDGAKTLIITNLYEEDRNITLDLQGFDNVSVTDIQLLSPEFEAESVTVEDYLSDGGLVIPAQSVMLLVFE